MDTSKLRQQIEETRRELLKLSQTHDFSDSAVVEKSSELDDLLNLYQAMREDIS